MNDVKRGMNDVVKCWNVEVGNRGEATMCSLKAENWDNKCPAFTK